MKRNLLLAIVAVVIVVAVVGVYFATTTVGQKSAWVIGAPLYLTGEFGTLGVADRTVITYEVDRINEGGGVAGKELQVISLDTKCDAAEEIKALNSLVTGSNVDLVLAQLSDAIPPMLDFMEEHNKLIATASAGTTALDEIGGTFFRFCPSDSIAGAARAAFVNQNFGGTSIAILYEQREGPMVDALACRDALVASGVEIAAEIGIVPEQSSYKETVRQLQNDGIETIVVAFMKSTAIQFFRDCESFDYKPNIVGSNDMAAQEIVDAVGSYLEGALVAYGGYDASTQWYADWEASVPMDEWEANNVMLPASWELIYATYSRDAIIGLALALEHAKTADPDTLAASLRYVCNAPGEEVGNFADGARLLREGKDINFQGASGPIDFNEYNSVLSAGTVQEVIDGQWTQTEVIPADTIADLVGWTS